MKTNILLLFAGLFCLLSCEDDHSATPNSLVTQSFNQKFPNASQVEWKNKNNYVTADFILDQKSTTAWFDKNGQWYMTKTELRNKTGLPEPVLTAFENSDYAPWYIDDIDELERLDAEKIYVIEIEKNKEEKELYYSADGILIKIITDNHNDDYEDYLPDNNSIPASVTTFILEKYPQARIIETEWEHGYLEIDIIHENRSKELMFDSDYQWLNTHYDIRQNEVNPLIMEVLNNSEYKNYHIDDIEKYEIPEGYYYLFELEKGELEIDIKIDTNGNITVVR